KRGAITFDYGNNIRTQAKKAGVENAYDIPGFVPEYIRPLFCEGKGPFRWVALSGDPEDIARTDALALELFTENATLARWMPLPAPPGFQFTTAVASASAIRNMLGWSLLPTGPITPNGVSNACSPAIRGWGFCGMQTPVTRARLNLLPQKRSISRWHRGPAPNEIINRAAGFCWGAQTACLRCSAACRTQFSSASWLPTNPDWQPAPPGMDASSV